jgi:hypothetical protein
VSCGCGVGWIVVIHKPQFCKTISLFLNTEDAQSSCVFLNDLDLANMVSTPPDSHNLIFVTHTLKNLHSTKFN